MKLNIAVSVNLFLKKQSEANLLCEFIILQENSVWIVHNGGRFDTIVIFKYLLENKKIFPQSVMCGNKIMKLFIEGKTIIFLIVILFYI